MANKKTMYKQCRLERQVKTGKQVETAWIPVKFAKKGKYLRLKEGDGWLDGWLVVSVFDQSLSQEELSPLTQQGRKTRQVSDI